jgi:hypothetical protein
VGWAGLVSCSSRKATFSQADSLTWTRRDSLWLSRSLQASIGQTMQLQHYTFSPPDSAGKQYVASATLLSATSDETYTEQATGEAKQTATLAATHTAQSTEQTITGTHTKRFPYWIVAAVGLLVAGALMYRKK